MKARRLILLAVLVLLLVSLPSHSQDKWQRCREMEKKGDLLWQKFKNGKACMDSDIGKGWTDCLFKADETEILLVGSIGRSPGERMFGFMGSGFYILSVDPAVKVRVFADEDLGFLVRIDGKDNLKDTRCLYNEAFITLDARVLNPGELNEIRYGPLLPHSKSLRDRIKDLQTASIALGFRPGPVDGVLGAKTRAAIEAYKRERNLPPKVADEEIFDLIEAEAGLRSLEKLEKLYEMLQ